MRFGAQKERFVPNDELKQLCLRYDLHMQQAQLKHLGTDANLKTMQRLVDDLKQRVQIETLCTVTDVNKETHEVFFTHRGKQYSVVGDKVVFAVGRAGSRVFLDWCKRNGVACANNQVDIGVRVESVSYTHLDVYKRQHFTRSENIVGLIFCLLLVNYS